MSNKNLKVYRIQFTTEVQEMQFKVKFPCQVKMVWKRSNEQAETSLVPVKDGVVAFNQTLKLYVNMYFDITTNRFVEKKCIYSFLIITEKGEKSAGNVTVDLSEFFNKRIYEMEEDFKLQKCPLPDAKIRMKISYEESTEQGYDSMSQISAASQQFDSTNASFEVSDLGQNSILSEEPLTKESQQKTQQKKEEQNIRQSIKYDPLNQSDLGGAENSEKQESTNLESQSHISALHKITGKINNYVFKSSVNLKNQIEGMRMRIRQLQEKNESEKFQRQKLQAQKEGKDKKILELEKNLQNQKQDQEAVNTTNLRQIEELKQDLLQSKKLNSQLESNLSSNDEAKSSYITELKSTFEQNEEQAKEKIKKLEDELLNEKKRKNEAIEEKKYAEGQVSQWKNKFDEELKRNTEMELKQKLREKELENLRIKMQDVYQSIVMNVGGILN